MKIIAWLVGAALGCAKFWVLLWILTWLGFTPWPALYSWGIIFVAWWGGGVALTNWERNAAMQQRT